MEEPTRCELEMDLSQMNQNERPAGSWLCCLPCYWLKRNTSFHKMSLSIVTLLVTVLLVASPVLFLISSIPGDKARDCAYHEKECAGRLPEKVCLEEECASAGHRILASMSRDGKPCQDFYHFACGAWEKRAQGQEETEEDRFVNFVTLQEQVDRTIQQLLTVGANSEPFEKLGDFYKSCIRAGDRRTSLLPMLSLLEDLGGYVMPSSDPPEDLTDLVFQLLRLNGAILFDIYLDSDFDNSSKLAPFIDLPLRTGFTSASKHYSGKYDFQEVFSKESSLVQNDEGNNISNSDGWSRSKNNAYNFIKASIEEKRLLVMEKIIRDFMPQNVSARLRINETQKTLHFANIVTKIRAPSRLNKQFSEFDDKKSESEPCWNSRKRKPLTRPEQHVHIQQYLYPGAKEIIKSSNRKSHVRMKLGELERKFPFIRWQDLLEKLFESKLAPDDSIFVMAPEYLDNLQRILHKFDSRVVHNGLLLIFATDTLYELVNISSTRDWPSFCNKITVRVFGKAVSILYVQQYGEEMIQKLRSRVTRIFDNLIKTFEKRISQTSWLDERTRNDVLDKLATLRVQFLTWPHYYNATYASSLMETVRVDPDDFFGNVIRRYRQLRNVPVSFKREESEEKRWAYPFVVNAFYVLTMNTIIIPLALLTQPYFREEVPLYLPYSTIGLILAHEILHGFDLKGIGYDADGKSGALLSPESRAKLEARLDCFVKQFSSAFWKKVNFLGTNVDVQFDWNITKNENMADISGLQIAYQAWKSITNSGREATLPGVRLNAQQLFFLNAAQTYCAMLSPADYIFLVEVDFHTPQPERVNGIMMNSPGFAEAFKCPLGSPMNPRKKCSTW